MTINYALFDLNLAALRETVSMKLSFFNEKSIEFTVETLIFPMAFCNARIDNAARSIFSPSHLLTTCGIRAYLSVSIRVNRECVRARVYACTCYRDNAERRRKMRVKKKN